MSEPRLCTQVGCEELAVYTYDWPGTPDRAVCLQHLGELDSVARAMGIGIALHPVDPAWHGNVGEGTTGAVLASLALRFADAEAPRVDAAQAVDESTPLREYFAERREYEQRIAGLTSQLAIAKEKCASTFREWESACGRATSANALWKEADGRLTDLLKGLAERGYSLSPHSMSGNPEGEDVVDCALRVIDTMSDALRTAAPT